MTDATLMIATDDGVVLQVPSTAPTASAATVVYDPAAPAPAGSTAAALRALEHPGALASLAIDGVEALYDPTGVNGAGRAVYVAPASNIYDSTTGTSVGVTGAASVNLATHAVYPMVAYDGLARMLAINGSTGVIAWLLYSDFTAALATATPPIGIVADYGLSLSSQIEFRRVDEGLAPNLFRDAATMNGPDAVVYTAAPPFAGAAYAPLVDPASTSAGFTQGWQNTGGNSPAIGATIADPPPVGGRFTLRWRVESGVDNAFGAARLDLHGPSGLVETVYGVLEQTLSARVRVFRFDGAIDFYPFSSFYVVAFEPPSGASQSIYGLQYHASRRPAFDIARQDFPVSTVPVPTPAPVTILLPAQIDVVAGSRPCVFWDSLSLNEGLAWGPQLSGVTTTPGIITADHYECDPAAAGTTVLGVQAFDPVTAQALATQTLSVVAVAATKAGSDIVCIIGDSRQDYAPSWAADLASPGTADPYYTITTTGTRTTSGAYHEARAGWSTYNYRYNATYGGFTNALFDPAAGMFSATYWAAQLAALERPLPTKIVWSLGGNEIPGNSGLADFVTAGISSCTNVNAMIANVQTAYPSIRHYVCTETPCGPGPNTHMAERLFRRAQLTIVRQQILSFDNRRAQGIFLIPTHCCFDRINGYPYTSVPSSPFSDLTVRQVTDGVHYNAGFARQQIADFVRQALKATA